MGTPVVRLTGALVLAAALFAAYTLIAANPAGSDLAAASKIQLKKPPQLTGEILEGTGI